MSWFIRLRDRFRHVVTRLNLNPDVGRDVFPERKYRPGPASQPAPELSLNFPLKQENLAEMTYATRKPRLARQAGVQYNELSSKPTEDFRNLYYACPPELWPLKTPTQRMMFDVVPFSQGDK